jgi:hypothetical protein
VKIVLTIPDTGLGPDVMPDVVQQRVGDAMRVVMEDAAGVFAEVTPVGIMGAAAGAWEKDITVDVKPDEVVGVIENAQPYLWYVIHGTGPSPYNPGKHLVRWVDKKLTVPQQYRIVRMVGASETAARNMLNRSSVKHQASALTVAVAFIIGAARKRRGSKPNDFITPAAARRMPVWDRILQDAVFGRAA